MLENKTKLGQEPAFPITDENLRYQIPCGMSKRFYAACQISANLISASLTDKRLSLAIDASMKKHGLSAAEATIVLVYEYVDEILKQE